MRGVKVKRLVVVGIMAAVGLAAAPALGQQPEKAQGEKDVKVYDFPEDVVSGDRHNPNGDVIGGEAKREVRSLITPRRHFILEIVKSSEDL